MKETLRACPHCDGRDADAKPGYPWALVKCGSCRARVMAPTVNEALALWNTRPAEDALVTALEELHAMVWGECPALLDEDKGGTARLDVEIRGLLAKHKETTG